MDLHAALLEVCTQIEEDGEELNNHGEFYLSHTPLSTSFSYHYTYPALSHILSFALPHILSLSLCLNISISRGLHDNSGVFTLPLTHIASRRI